MLTNWTSGSKGHSGHVNTRGKKGELWLPRIKEKTSIRHCRAMGTLINNSPGAGKKKEDDNPSGQLGGENEGHTSPSGTPLLLML